MSTSRSSHTRKHDILFWAGLPLVRYPEVRGCPYLGGRNVDATIGWVLRRLSASQSAHYRRFHCTGINAVFFIVFHARISYFLNNP